MSCAFFFFFILLSLIVSSLFENIPFHVLKAFGEYSLPDTIPNPSGSENDLKPTYQWIDTNGWYLGTLGSLLLCRCLTCKHMWRGAKDTPGFRGLVTFALKCPIGGPAVWMQSSGFPGPPSWASRTHSLCSQPGKPLTAVPAR